MLIKLKHVVKVLSFINHSNKYKVVYNFYHYKYKYSFLLIKFIFQF